MALSVLQIQYGENSHGLYCSEQQKMILFGNQDEMFGWKHVIEEVEQQHSNDKYLKKIRKERMKLLIQAGNTKEKAESFLKERMPYLFK